VVVLARPTGHAGRAYRAAVGDDRAEGEARVMVVDDLPLVRRAMTRVVGAVEGLVVVCEAATGEEALAQLETRDVALVLMDVRMPGMGGIRAAEIMRTRFPGVRVVLLSAYDSDMLPAALELCGACFCRKSSFGPDQLDEAWDAVRASRG
jgi:DNA-binding NarL/FixJ family response regulator